MQHILDVQIPDENPQGAPGGDFQNIATSPDMFGALGARALQSYGAGLENLGSEPLHIVEIQVGQYLGEDDIQRYEDNYGR